MTESNYFALLDRVKVEMPTHPLLSQLEKGPGVLNNRRLLSIINDLQEPEEVVNIPDDLDDDVMSEQIVDIDAFDPVLKGLYIKKSNLFVTRAKHSNRLHECSSDAERAKVVEDILIAQSEIESHFAKMRHYRQNGFLPDDGDEFPIPKDGAQLIMLRNSIRARISQTRNVIKELYHIENKTLEVQRKMEKYDRILKNFEQHNQILNNEIKLRKVDTGIHE